MLQFAFASVSVEGRIVDPYIDGFLYSSGKALAIPVQNAEVSH